jgi:hypothetical protein
MENYIIREIARENSEVRVKLFIVNFIRMKERTYRKNMSAK